MDPSGHFPFKSLLRALGLIKKSKIKTAKLFISHKKITMRINKLQPENASPPGNSPHLKALSDADLMKQLKKAKKSAAHAEDESNQNILRHSYDSTLSISGDYHANLDRNFAKIQKPLNKEELINTLAMREYTEEILTRRALRKGQTFNQLSNELLDIRIKL